MKIFETNQLSLATASYRFIVPSYQRPYVWTKENIEVLLNDCLNAMIKDKDASYFIGTIITSYGEDKEALELIDGQQRLTTLWLLSYVFKNNNIESDIRFFFNYRTSNTQKNKTSFRISFPIREEVETYFHNLLENKDTNTESINEQEYVKDIHAALKFIDDYIKSWENNISLKNFGDYLYTNVFMINNICPNHTNLNKLFTTINNSGKQLEQTDILKASLLKQISTIKEKVTYSKLWESCESMSQYFEFNVRAVFNNTVWKNITEDKFSSYKSTLNFEYKINDREEQECFVNKEEESTSLSSLFEASKESDRSQDTNEANDKNYVHYRSIIDFPQLIVHTYRIFLFKTEKRDFEAPFNIDKLLEITKPLSDSSEEKIKDFIELLWKVRYLFDKHVVKWVNDENLEELRVSKMRMQPNKEEGAEYLKRDIAKLTEEHVLQCVLHFTNGSYKDQYWLTPYLYSLLEDENKSYTHLKKIEKHLYISRISRKESSFELMKKSFNTVLCSNLIDHKLKVLTEEKGTGFAHYWFYILEYILWIEQQEGIDKKDSMFAYYRIRSMTSIEHVFPQNEEYQRIRGDKKEATSLNLLNNFGNLALLNISQNSSYGNQSVEKKHIDFKNKKSYDSLKLKELFNRIVNYDEGDKFSVNLDLETLNSLIKEHQEEMINKIREYYLNDTL